MPDTYKIRQYRTTDDTLKIVQEQLEVRDDQIQHLREICAKYESEINADSRVKELTEKLAELKGLQTFTITSEEQAKIREWTIDHRKHSGAIGGQFEYRFRPTGVGTIVQVTDGVDTLTVRDLSDC